MRYGITMFATDVSIDVVELAREAEARGLQSLWLPEHTHIPVSRLTPPPTGDVVLPYGPFGTTATLTQCMIGNTYSTAFRWGKQWPSASSCRASERACT